MRFEFEYVKNKRRHRSEYQANQKIGDGYLPRRYLSPPLEADSVHIGPAAATYSPKALRETCCAWYLWSPKTQQHTWRNWYYSQIRNVRIYSLTSVWFSAQVVKFAKSRIFTLLVLDFAAIFWDSPPLFHWSNLRRMHVQFRIKHVFLRRVR